MVDGGIAVGHVLEHTGQAGDIRDTQRVDDVAADSDVAVGLLLQGRDRVQLPLMLGELRFTGLAQPVEAHDDESHQQQSNQSVFIHYYIVVSF